MLELPSGKVLKRRAPKVTECELYNEDRPVCTIAPLPPPPSTPKTSPKLPRETDSPRSLMPGFRLHGATQIGEIEDDAERWNFKRPAVLGFYWTDLRVDLASPKQPLWEGRYRRSVNRAR